MVEERAFWLAWSKVPGIGPILLKRLQNHFGELSQAWIASDVQLGAVEGFGVRTVKGVVEARSRLDPEKLFQEHQQQNPCFWTPADPDYPRLLLEIPNAPPVLYYRGVVHPEENQAVKPAVAIVGTRDPSDYGKRWTRKISTALAQKGFTVVSGMAEGIDTEAHSACLEAGGRTLAVLGTGVDIVYPPRNRNLYADIQTQGLVLSEYAAATPPDRSHFPARNRIIAGLSRAVLVMEAPSRSGALITAHVANDFCRDVYVLPGSLDNPRAIGCLGLLSRGAQVILNEGLLLEMLGAMPEVDSVAAVQPVEPVFSTPVPNLEPELKSVFAAISTEPMPFDAIVQKTSLDAGSVSSALLQLELLGLVSQLPGMQYRRS